MVIKLFVKEDCPSCPAAKRVCDGLDDVQEYDVGDVDGLAEASLHGIMSTPSVLVVDEEGNEVAAWLGVAPEAGALRQLVAGGG